MATDTSPPPIADQQQLLIEAKRAVSRGSADYARKVIFAWFARCYPEAAITPYLVETGHCADCSSGADPDEDVNGALCEECYRRLIIHAWWGRR